MRNKTIRIPGKVTILAKVCWPAASSSSDPDSPAEALTTLALSIQWPIMGWKIAVENIPIPPTTDIPKAPLNGAFCATDPIIVGQK